MRTKCYRCGAPRQADSAPWNDKKGKGPKAPWVVLLRKDPVLCRPQLSGAGVGNSATLTPLDVNKSAEDMVKALKLLQDVMTNEDFFKYEKMVMFLLRKKRKRKNLGKRSFGVSAKKRKT